MEHVCNCTYNNLVLIIWWGGDVFPSTWSDCDLCFAPWVNLFFQSRVTKAGTWLAIFRGKLKWLSVLSTAEILFENTTAGTQAWRAQFVSVTSCSRVIREFLRYPSCLQRSWRKSFGTSAISKWWLVIRWDLLASQTLPDALQFLDHSMKSCTH